MYLSWIASLKYALLDPVCVAQLAGASSQFARVVGLISGQGT